MSRIHLLFAGLIPLSLFSSCLAAVNEQGYQELKKGKVGAPPLHWLKNYTIPVPIWAYNDSAEIQDDFDLYWLHEFKYELKFYLDTAIEFEIPNNASLDPTNFYCPEESEANLALNQTCPNSTYQSLAYLIFDDLASYRRTDDCDRLAGIDCTPWMDSILERDNHTNTANLIDKLQKQSDVAERNYTTSYYRKLGDYIGVGFPVNDTCRADINMVLDERLDEFDKAGSAAATTLMALIPALLTIGNLFVPRSSEAFATSFLVGVMSAMFSLGLPVRSISGVNSDQCANTFTFPFKTRSSIANYGRANPRVADGGRNSASQEAHLPRLQKWSKDYDEMEPDKMKEEQAATDAIFSKISKRAQDWQSRMHWWNLASFLVALSQALLFIFSIGPLFLGYGTPMLLFDCKNYWTSAWLVIAAGISAVFRFVMWQKGVHERVHIYAMGDFAVKTFRDFAHKTKDTRGGKEYAHVETELPPLYPPLMNAFKLKVRNVFGSLLRAISKIQTSTGPLWDISKKRTRTNHGYEDGSDFFRRLRNLFGLLFDALVDNVKNPLLFLNGGFRLTTAPDAARRWRPLVVLMHLSTGGRNPLKTLLTGLIEGFILILSTAFFAAQWGGNLLVMCYTTAVLLVSITLGRALGLFYVAHTSKIYGLHVIETQDPAETRGCLRIICSMERVLVYVNGSWFFEGHRLDVRPGWHAFQRCYNLGHFDDEFTDRAGCRCSPLVPPSPFLLSLSPLTPTSTSSITRKPLPKPPMVRTVSVTSRHSSVSERPSSRSTIPRIPTMYHDSSVQLIPIEVRRQFSLGSPTDEEKSDWDLGSRPALTPRDTNESTSPLLR